MRKSLLTLAFSLVICFFANAEEYQVEKMTFGSGGFVGASAGNYKVSGIIGQLIIGRSAATSVTGEPMYVHAGFWVQDDAGNEGIEDAPAYQRGIANYPNPARNFTTFEFELAEDSYVTLHVYDMMGGTIANVLEGSRSAGINKVDWNLANSFGGEIASGSYRYELRVSPMSAGNTSSDKNYALQNVIMISK